MLLFIFYRRLKHYFTLTLVAVGAVVSLVTIFVLFVLLTPRKMDLDFQMKANVVT
jgi:hypothetical protein